MMVSPPKPWERANPNANANANAGAGATIGAGQLTAISSTSTAIAAPAIPSRPDSLASSSAISSTQFNNNPMSGSYGGYGASSSYPSAYNSYNSPYSSSISSPYSRFGNSPYSSSYSSYGSSYGGYNSPYSSYGGSYGGYNSPYNRFGSGMGMGMGMHGRPGLPLDPNDPNAPPGMGIAQSSQTAFQTLDQIVQAFGGFAQMLDSTFHATYSSFMAMVGVAEQFGNLRTYLAQIISVVSIYRWARNTVYKRVLKKPPPADASELSPEDFAKYQDSIAAKRSSKPVIVFLLFAVGIPYLISKLVQRLNRQRLEAAAAAAAAAADPNAPPQPVPGMPVQDPALHPSQIKDLEFARAVYEYRPVPQPPTDLSFGAGEIIAVLQKTDPATGQQADWWRGRLQNGAVGWFPATYVEIIQKRPASVGASGGAPMTPGGGAAAVNTFIPQEFSTGASDPVVKTLT
ncbi:Peroxin 13, N-terminal region-domain-containing protein [Cladochytrium replicatum]|nr:Peroxin 13, N-terminal region-domain-containing protein [Cladochytrium replicatum]